MVRPLKIENDDRRPAIDFSIANHCQLDAIAAHFDIDLRTLGAYCRRLNTADPKRLPSLRIATLPADDQLILVAATAYAAHLRRSLSNQAEALFVLARP
jgi:hypothetical protein